MNSLNITLAAQMSGLTEYWADIKDYEGYYQVSNFGCVRSVDRVDIAGHRRTGKILKFNCSGSAKYARYRLSKEGQKTNFDGHRLVAQAFISNPDNSPVVNHINGVKTDNRLTNLEWCTAQDNIKHACKMGLNNSNYQKGESNPQAKLSTFDVLEIKRLLIESKLSQREIASKFNISEGAIYNIKSGSNWKHLFKLPYIFYCSSWKKLINYYR